MYRIAFYSHDSYGLGHFSRCQKLARAIVRRFGEAEGLFLTGSPWADRFDPPGRFRVATLPPVVKAGAGTYRSRDSAVRLDLVRAERLRRIAAALAELRPHLLVVDNVPGGLLGEMTEALGATRERFGTRTVLALRDVLDGTDAITREWLQAGADEIVRELYDEIWLFGDEEHLAGLLGPQILPTVEAKVVTCGRLGHGRRGAAPPAREPRAGRPRILVTGGGGGDAEGLVRTYVEAVRTFRPDVTSRIVLGPEFPSPAFVRGVPPGARVRRFLPGLQGVIARCDLVVSMAGYNTVCEILESGRPAVLVPRVVPRREQLIRATRLRDRGRASMIHPDDLTPESLWRAIRELLDLPAPAPEPLPGGEVAAERAAALLRAAS